MKLPTPPYNALLNRCRVVEQECEISLVKLSEQKVALVDVPSTRVNMTYDASPTADQPIIVFDSGDSQT